VKGAESSRPTNDHAFAKEQETMESTAFGRTRSAIASVGRAEYGDSAGKAFQQIRDLIVHGRFAPGSWIVESDLCEHLRMSRTPVRGALYLLEREGFVRERRNGSKAKMFVAPLTEEDAGELYSMIGRIEGLAGRRAAQLPRAERESLAGKLTGINLKLDRIAREQGGDGPAIFDLDHEFHRLLVDAGLGPRLKMMHRAVEPQAERYWRLYANSIMHQLHVSVAEHEEIVAVLIEGEPDQLDRALCANWENGCTRLAALIDRFGERGSW
jgi:DNA-binding GntR family transcriptional regulator